MLILVVGTTPRSVMLTSAMLEAGANVLFVEDVEAIPRSRQFTKVWVDKYYSFGVVKEPAKQHGPQKKGRGGKIRRW